MVIGEQGLAALALGKFEEVYEIEGIYNIIYVPESFLGDFSSILVNLSSIFRRFLVNLSSIYSILEISNAENYWSAHKF
jgi:hypothetical protein